MIVQTFQSQAVLRIIKSGNIYRAKQSIALKREYAAMIDMWELNCECPIFGVVKGKKQNTGGKVSNSVLLTLNVPNQFVHLTEYADWADFLEVFQHTKPNDYRKLQADCEAISIRGYRELLQKIKTQKKVQKYEYPQVILEKINPSWLKSYEHNLHRGFLARLREMIK